jgi:hypothetical protein
VQQGPGDRWMDGCVDSPKSVELVSLQMMEQDEERLQVVRGVGAG